MNESMPYSRDLYGGNGKLREGETFETRREEALLREAQKIARMGYWELDITENRVHWSDEVFTLFGFEPQSFQLDHEGFLALVHPEDRDRVGQAYTLHLQTRKDYDTIFRIITADHQTKYVHERCRTDYDEEGKPVRSLGIVTDFTWQMEAEEARREREKRAQRQRAAVSYIFRKESIFQGSLTEALEKINFEASKAFDVEKVGVWIFSEGNEALRCFSAYDAKTGCHTSGDIIHRWEYPEYFETLLSDRTIAAEDVMNDPRLAKIVESRLAPSRVTAMLDAVIIQEGRLVGVFCLGHTETPRKWHTGEEAFATTIAAIVAQLFENAERRRVAEVLRQNEANLTAILENDAVSIWALDKEYRVIYTNPVFYQGFFDAYGVRLNKGVPYLEALPPVKRALWKENFDAVLNRRSVQFFDTVAIGQESIYIDVAMNPVLSENEVKGISVFSKNITEQILAEKALQESQKRYHDILEVAPVGIMVYQNEKVRYINPSGLALLGAERVETVLDKNVRSIIHPDDADSCLNTIRDILSGVASIPAIEARILRFDGTQRFTELTFSSLHYDGALAVQVIARDITERREAEEDRIARKVAEEANRAKSVFLSNMSHEIRTPLNAIIGFAQILKRDSSLSPKQVEQLQTIARSGEHLLKLINDILDLSKIEAGKLQIHPSPFDLHKLIADIENMFRFRAEEKGLQFIVELKESVPQYVRSDEGKLRQILINLLGNSVKFTKFGGLVLRLKAGSPGKEGTLQKELRLFIEVEDTGPGIPEDEIPQIFDSFRVSSAGRAAGGTGLGLAITKSLLELMGGGISVNSQVSRGSIFRFELPIVRLENLEVEGNRTKRTIVGLEPRSGPYRILIVDDQKDNRELLRDLLEPIGFRVRTAQNGQEGLYLFERWFPNLILMDMRMPILDGYEATRKIKATERGRKTPVIAVTASAFEDEEKSVLATGVDGYLRKPVCPDDLFELIEKLLKARFLYKDPETAPSESERAPLIQQEDLASIPDSVRLEMRKALEEGEMLKLKGLIDRIKESDPRIAQGLLFLVKRYDYEQLGKLL